MRIWFSGRRIRGIRSVVGFGPEDWGRSRQRPIATSGQPVSPALAALFWTVLIMTPSFLVELVVLPFSLDILIVPNLLVAALVFFEAYRACRR